MRPRPSASQAATRAEGSVTTGWKRIVTAPSSISRRTWATPDRKCRLSGAVRRRVTSSTSSAPSGASRATRNS